MTTLLNFFFGNSKKLSNTEVLNFPKLEPKISEAQKKADEKEILRVLRSATSNLTCPEIAKILGWEAAKVFRRMFKLRESNLIKIDERRQCTIHKTICSAYLIV